MAKLEIYAKPPNLYRYRPLGPHAEREVRALREGYIFCPAYSSMNDPMEGLYRLSSRFAVSNSGERRQADIQEALRTMGIASMSEVHDHEPMWAHYADQFAGMCVQYNMNRLLNELDPGIAVTRMMYSENEPVLLEDRSSPVDRARLCLSSKTIRWASEREWRLFRLEQGPATYRDLRTVTRIYLGSRVNARDEDLVNVAAEAIGAPVSRMRIDAYAISFTSSRKGHAGDRSASRD